MMDDRVPKAVFHGHLKEGSRTARGQKLRFKDRLKSNLKLLMYPTGNAMHQTDLCGDLIAKSP